MSTGRTPFLSVHQGCGSVYRFSQTATGPSHITHIGTVGCLPCVGVYLPIDAERCFVAHINGFVSDPAQTNGIRTNLSRDELEEVRRETLTKLRENVKANNWTAQQVRNSGKRPVLACSYFNHVDGRPGPYIVKALSEFLGMELEGSVDQNAEGFIVEHARGIVRMVSDFQSNKVRDLGFDEIGDDREKEFWDIRVYR